MIRLCLAPSSSRPLCPSPHLFDASQTGRAGFYRYFALPSRRKPLRCLSVFIARPEWPRLRGSFPSPVRSAFLTEPGFHTSYHHQLCLICHSFEAPPHGPLFTARSPEEDGDANPTFAVRRPSTLIDRPTPLTLALRVGLLFPPFKDVGCRP